MLQLSQGYPTCSTNSLPLYRQSTEKWGVSGVNPKGGMLLFPALGGIGDEGRHCQKMKKF
jgi:hypothetical protein